MLLLTVQHFYKTMIFLILSLITGLVHADPPRTLNTSFADYAQQQKQHDTQLQQGASNAKSASSSAPVLKVEKAGATPKTTSSAKTKSNAKSSTPININQADESSLSNTLTGVGPAKARAIVEYRREHGGFKRIEDLVEVKGIGPATLEKNRHLLRLN